MEQRFSLTEPIQSITCIDFNSISIHCVCSTLSFTFNTYIISDILAAGGVRCPQSGLAFRLAFLLELTITSIGSRFSGHFHGAISCIT